MYKVLFVCLGNICRSPMAHAVFRQLVIHENRSEDFIVDSCGTGGWHQGEPAHHGTLSILKQNKVDTSELIARKITKDDFFDFDYIIPMDEQNRKDILLFAAKNKITVPKLRLLLEYVSDEDRKLLKLNSLDVPDPYYTGEFDKVFRFCVAACGSLFREISGK